MHIIYFYTKTHDCSLKDLRKSSSFALWSSWVFCTTTIFSSSLKPMIFLLLINHPTKPLSPGEWPHGSIFGPRNHILFLLTRFGFLKYLHQQVSSLDKLTLPPSLSSKETRIQRFWPLQELPRCLQHFVKHLVCMASFGMVFSQLCVRP